MIQSRFNSTVATFPQSDGQLSESGCWSENNDMKWEGTVRGRGKDEPESW
jgi:hypothetical protein